MFDNLSANNQKQGQRQGANSLGQSDQGGTKSSPPPQSSGENIQPFASPLGQSGQGLSIPNNQSPPSGPQPPTPQPQVSAPAPAKPIEDMFSGTDSQEKPAIFQAKTPPASINQAENMPPSQIDPYTGEQIKAKNKTIVFALMLISLMLVAMLGWYAYRMFFSSIAPGIVNPVIEPTPSTSIIPSGIIEQKASVDLPINDFSNRGSEQVQDTDGDGLSDDEENDLGTDYLNTDTDGDGLFDREEVKVYKTDPLDPDTDKDGYADGIEVEGGYNPNGEGSLYDAKQ